MEVLPREKDKLLLFTAGLLAERRRRCGLKLNYPELWPTSAWQCLKARATGKAWRAYGFVPQPAHARGRHGRRPRDGPRSAGGGHLS